VFEEFGGSNPIADIAPNLFLFGWRNLGGDAESEQRQYLRNLFDRRPEQINQFLRLMFRGIPFIDDYTSLKPLIDYSELSRLIALHRDVLNAEKVHQFEERYRADSES